MANDESPNFRALFVLFLHTDKEVINVDTNYKPNSHVSKAAHQQEKPKMEKVIRGTATVKKKSPVKKFADVFIAEDADNVKSYILTDVVVPAVKKLLYNVFTDGLNMILYGGAHRSESQGTLTARVSYDRFSDKSGPYKPAAANLQTTRFDFDNISFKSRGDAEIVLTQMEESIASYGYVTVADLYDMAQLTGPYTGNKYGWVNLRNAQIIRSGDGFVIKLPKAMPID